MKRKKQILAVIIVCVLAFMAINNCEIFPVRNAGSPELLAHRGLAQTFDISRVTWDTNTAAIIYPPEHPYIENTLPSINAAFACGADMVEFDIRVTKDKELAVFHDYAVDSRTEYRGKVYEYTLAELKAMDVGYGYTADAGKTFPLRGTGNGLLPSFDEVMHMFPDRKFLVHIRDDGDEIGVILSEKLKRMDKSQIENLSIYGNDAAIQRIRKEYPKMQALSRKMMMRAVIEYELIGWSGYIPESIRNLELHIPLGYAKYLWGWPHKFVRRMQGVHTRTVLVIKRGQADLIRNKICGWYRRIIQGLSGLKE